MKEERIQGPETVHSLTEKEYICKLALMADFTYEWNRGTERTKLLNPKWDLWIPYEIFNKYFKL